MADVPEKYCPKLTLMRKGEVGKDDVMLSESLSDHRYKYKLRLWL
jgi:hypothetical protein